MEEAEKRVMDIANKAFVDGTSCTVTKTVSRPAMEKSERNFMLLETLNGIYEKCGHYDLYRPAFTRNRHRI